MPVPAGNQLGLKGMHAHVADLETWLVSPRLADVAAGEGTRLLQGFLPMLLVGCWLLLDVAYHTTIISTTPPSSVPHHQESQNNVATENRSGLAIFLHVCNSITKLGEVGRQDSGCKVAVWLQTIHARALVKTGPHSPWHNQTFFNTLCTQPHTHKIPNETQVACLCWRHACLAWFAGCQAPAHHSAAACSQLPKKEANTEHDCTSLGECPQVTGSAPRLGFSEKCLSDNYTFGSLAQLASVLPRPPHRIVGAIRWGGLGRTSARCVRKYSYRKSIFH